MLKRIIIVFLNQKVPLHLAAGEGHLDIVRYFVEDKGADKNVKGKHGVSDVNILTFRGYWYYM